ncbi:tyrosine-type recombinase/integrase [Vibrio superstes]|uniref:Integrase n=1 Tax=Vibrio superstes NBRC 103154 TaxID=1219062 RepID=A0A511QMF8_9VIBR|nr:site-specific integrase [Vibrio superstes]GEM78503.1 integrase [Vibrio superstes NBRC 103154]
MFTAKYLQSLEPKKNPYYVTDKTQERGTGRLVVQVLPRGRKSFKFRYFHQENASYIAIGDFPATTLHQARQRKQHYSKLLSEGKDPKIEIEKEASRKQQLIDQENQNGSIKELLDSQAEHKKRNNKRNYEKELGFVEGELYKFIDPETKANKITPQDLIPMLASMINRGAVSKANKVRSILHAAFGYGMNHDNDPANFHENMPTRFQLLSNPVSAIPVQTAADKPGDHFLSFDELFKLLDDMDHRFDDLRLRQTTRNLIKVCLYTGGQRPYEICNTLWTDIDWELKIITVRPEIFKTNVAHVIPLTETVLEILKQMKSNSQSLYVFNKHNTLDEPTPTNTLAQAITYYRNVTDINHFTARDFRRTFKTLGGNLSITKEHRDRIQGHAFGDVSSKHYDRYEYLKEKREGLVKWENVLNRVTPFD